jgi:ribonuclease J
MHPLKKDLELTLSFLNPTYYAPIKAFYKEMKVAEEAAIKVGMKKENIIIAENGEIKLIENGKFSGTERRLKNVGNVIVENTSNAEIAAEIIQERKTLSEEGIAVIGIMIDKDTKKLISQIDVQMRGVMFLKKHGNIVDLVKEKTEEIINDASGKFNIGNVS